MGCDLGILASPQKRSSDPNGEQRCPVGGTADALISKSEPDITHATFKRHCSDNRILRGWIGMICQMEINRSRPVGDIGHRASRYADWKRASRVAAQCWILMGSAVLGWKVKVSHDQSILRQNASMSPGAEDQNAVIRSAGDLTEDISKPPKEISSSTINFELHVWPAAQCQMACPLGAGGWHWLVPDARCQMPDAQGVQVPGGARRFGRG